MSKYFGKTIKIPMVSYLRISGIFAKIKFGKDLFNNWEKYFSCNMFKIFRSIIMNEKILPEKSNYLYILFIYAHKNA